MTGPEARSLAPAIVTVLRRQGPTDELRLASMLMQAGLDVSGDRLAEGIARAGATIVEGPEGPLVALPTAPPRGTPGSEPNRVRDVLVQVPPAVLVAIVVVLLLVGALLVANLNHGRRGAPTIRYTPPTTAPR